ncbi:MAG: diguanylate cyclase [Planctomycetota bacterium]
MIYDHTDSPDAGAAAMPEPRRDADARGRGASRSASVVVAQRDAATRSMLIATLRGAGHRVWACASTRRAATLVAARQPDLVLLDLADGAPALGLCGRLAMEPPPAPLVIFVATGADRPARILGLEAGAADCIAGALDPDEVLARAHVALRLKARLDALAAVAGTDPLTGLANRNQLDQRLDALVAAAARHDRRLGCLLLDVDRFKAINDLHGHGAGDAVLCGVAGRLRRTCRASDQMIRYGGEEFLVVAPETGLAAARTLAERVRKVIGSRAFAAPSLVGRARLAVTASVGVAEWRPGMTGADLVRRADAALVRAKRSGRDRVVVAASRSVE